MTPTVEFFFDFVSPYSYLAAARVDLICAKRAAPLVWKPMFLAAVLRDAGNSAPAYVLPKAAYIVKDATRWAELLGYPPLRFPDSFPFNSALANRVAIVVGQREPLMAAFCLRLYEKLWAEGADGAAKETLASVVREVGLDPEAVLAEANGESAREQLKANSSEAVARGAFGAPTFFVGNEMFVGNDRLDFVERALLQGA